MYDDVSFSVLKGKTLKEIKIDREGDSNYDEIFFELVDGTKYRMYHSQDCCESVNIHEIVGDIEDLIGSEILFADEETNDTEDSEPLGDPKYAECWTWTFYKIGTIKGSVTISWYGTSNGYYSESVNFGEIDESCN